MSVLQACHVIQGVECKHECKNTIKTRPLMNYSNHCIIVHLFIFTLDFAAGDERCKLSDEIDNFLPHANIVRVQRKHFDDQKGRKYS